MGEKGKYEPQYEEETEKIFDDFGIDRDTELEEFTVTNKEIVINGKLLREDDKIYDLTDIIEEPANKIVSDTLNDRITQKISEISEKIAREMFPQIAERVIREEIEKLKHDMDDSES
jgi:hypothetical protein